MKTRVDNNNPNMQCVYLRVELISLYMLYWILNSLLSLKYKNFPNTEQNASSFSLSQISDMKTSGDTWFSLDWGYVVGKNGILIVTKDVRQKKWS